MTDLTRSGTADFPGESPPPPDWKTFAREGAWRRAQAAATISGADPYLIATLTLLSSLQADVRARRYAAAKRNLSGYIGSLSDLEGHQPSEAALLRSLVPPELLGSALDALEAGTGEGDPAELQLKVQPAYAHALTRAEAVNAQGVLHALRQEDAAARIRFEEALTHDPEHYRARMNIGNLDLEAGDFSGAEAAYREVLRLAPDYGSAHHNLGVALRKQGKLYESVGAIRKGQRLSLREAKIEAKEDMEEQMRRSPKLRLVRVAIFVGVVLLLALVAFLGRGGN